MITQDQMNELDKLSKTKLSDGFCVFLTHYMMGYMRMTQDTAPAGNIRQEFFRQIKTQLEKKP